MNVDFNSFYESFDSSNTATSEDVAFVLEQIIRVLKHKEIKDIFHMQEQRNAVDKLCDKVGSIKSSFLQYSAQEGFDGQTVYENKKKTVGKDLKMVYESLSVFVPILEQRNLKSDLLNKIKFNTEQLVNFI